MPLGRKKILEGLLEGWLVCDPEPETVEPTHIDLHLGQYYYVPRLNLARKPGSYIVNPRETDPAELYVLIDGAETGGIYIPAASDGHSGFCLAHTEEFAGSATSAIVPNIDTCSTDARWGLSSHRTAGRGDPGFRGRWTLEIDNKLPYPIFLPLGMRICSLSFETVEGETDGSSARYPIDARYNYSRETWKPEAMLPRKGNV